MLDRVPSVTCAAAVACSRPPRSGAAGETLRYIVAQIVPFTLRPQHIVIVSAGVIRYVNKMETRRVDLDTIENDPPFTVKGSTPLLSHFAKKKEENTSLSPSVAWLARRTGDLQHGTVFADVS